MKSPLPIAGFLAPVVLSAVIGAQGAAVIDAANVTGSIRNLQGVNAGPLNLNQGWDMTGWYRRLRVESVRTHDFYGPLDIPTIFPDQSADETNPASYDFTTSDQQMAALIAGGARPFLRLGISWNQKGWSLQMTTDKLAEVCRRIVMHYHSGWAAGMQLDLEWVEFWNEPNGPGFWPGTPQQFYASYDKLARGVRQLDPAIKIGACGLAGHSSATYRDGLIGYCAQNGVPLDFYSWHLYGTRSVGGKKTPEAFDVAKNSREVQAVLDQHGMSSTVQVVSEWNVALGGDPGTWLSDVTGAAYCASFLTYAQDENIALTHHYRGDIHGGGAGGMGLFANTTTPQARAWVMLMHGRLGLTPDRLSVTGTDQTGFAILAGRSQSSGEIRFTASDYLGTTQTRTVELRNLPAGRYLVTWLELRTNGNRVSRRANLVNATGGTLSLSLPQGSYVSHALVRPAPGLDPVIAFDDPVAPWQQLTADVTVAGANPGDTYVVLLSASGGFPGTSLPGGLTLPLNFDLLTTAGLAIAGTTAFRGATGIVPPSGNTFAHLSLGTVPVSGIGMPITAAALSLSPAGFAASGNSDVLTIR